MAGVTPSFTVKFDLDSESADFKKNTYTDNTDYAGAGYDVANVVGYFRLTNPMGVVYYEGNFDSPNIDGAVPTLSYKKDIPLISTVPVGFMLGKYTFEYFIRIDIGGGEYEYYSTSVTYTLSPPTTLVDATTGEIKSACLTYEANCFCRQIVLTDETEYGVYTTIDREILLHPPSIAAADDATTSASTLTYLFNVSYASYEYHLNTLLTFVEDAVTVSIRVTDDEYQIIKCNKLSATLVNCYTRYAQAWKTQINDNGGRGDNAWTMDMFSLVVYFTEYNEQLRLGNWSRVDALYDIIWALMIPRIDCSCDCENETPTIIDPYCGVTVSGSTYTFAKTDPVTVSVVGTTVTYGLDADFVTKVNSLYVDALTSEDESVDISSVIAGSTKTWKLSVKNHLAFNVLLKYNTGTDISVTISDLVRQGTRYVASFSAGDIQVINYSHASLAALNAERAVIKIENFLSSAPGGGADVPDKLDVDIREVVLTGDAEDNYNATFPYFMRIKRSSNDGFMVQFFTLDGLPITMADFIATVDHITLTVKINQ